MTNIKRFKIVCMHRWHQFKIITVWKWNYFQLQNYLFGLTFSLREMLPFRFKVTCDLINLLSWLCLLLYQSAFPHQTHKESRSVGFVFGWSCFIVVLGSVCFVVRILVFFFRWFLVDFLFHPFTCIPSVFQILSSLTHLLLIYHQPSCIHLFSMSSSTYTPASHLVIHLSHCLFSCLSSFSSFSYSLCFLFSCLFLLLKSKFVH